MAHSRWLTTANRILRLYVSTAIPSEGLKLLSEYVMKVYAPSWFEIKKKSQATHGPRHLHSLIKKCSFLPPEYKTLVFDVIQRNSYFAHSENILLAMMEDSRPYVRELALRRVLKARRSGPDRTIRRFDLSPLNFEADEYYNLVNWESPMEPAATIGLSEEEIMTFIKSKAEFEALKLPCHTQAVERGIKLVTEASVAVCGEVARDGFIRTRQKSRQDMPTYESKKEFFKTYSAVKMLNRLPTGTSIWTIRQMIQNIRTGQFQPFNWGPEMNMKKYGAKKVSSYPIGNVTVPTAIYYTCCNDYLSSAKDSEILRSKLPNVARFYQIPYKKFNHGDFLWAKDSYRLFYKDVLDLIDKYSGFKKTKRRSLNKTSNKTTSPVPIR